MKIVFALSLLVLPSLAAAQEVAVPDTPVPSTITSYRVTNFSMEHEGTDWRFIIIYKDSNGKVYQDEHYGLSTVTDPGTGQPVERPEGADALMKQINVGNFTTTSLIKRLLQHLVQHGKIPPSSVQGTPEK